MPQLNEWPLPVMCLLIFLARIGDVSLGTLRTVAIWQGRRGMAWVLGFFEVLIWVYAVSQVIVNLNHWALAVSYALGFATGNYVGLTIEQWWAPGRQVVRFFTRMGLDVAEQLRAAGFRVTTFEGQGRDGPVQSLYVESNRREVPRITEIARGADPHCYYVVDDVRHASSVALEAQRSGGWLAALKMK